MNKIQEAIESINSQPWQPLPKEFESNESLQEHCLEFAKRIYETGAEELYPQWMVGASNGQVAIIMTPFDGEESKQLVAAGLRKMMKEVHAKRFAFVSEAWMVTRKTMSEMKGRTPSECDDRIEVVNIVVGDHEATTVHGYEIIRDWESGKVTDLKPLQAPSEKATELTGGTFSNMLC